MDTMPARGGGVDVHQKQGVACLLTPGTGAAPAKEIRTCGTMTAARLARLARLAWLARLEEAGGPQVAMASTGVSWNPLYPLFDGALPSLVVNAAHLKAGPGRPPDVKDAEWIATLRRHGLLRPSGIPDRPQRELRALTR